ncbi:hypothetical protein HUA74_01265 [Myxococcus sp. CA051A]|uniref:Uncharacterized protein n=1 Tax=Myxococcus llanfairpwllgwyngyllgogerychwyrndrobwllllantysiliogogogochensis TaxID=2590453 RepID=A0A540WP86_9BACT|nr:MULTISPECIES: hypothetical protein [Myxococcus]NTX00701.1 hypothetical protein [Myxococcus sp. CA040A]NTX59280.1 hypothetical protein [Myxococcus sp. CA051A]TQF10244.1 hypothetical protein FJV41_40440 [Myxococcus llanfairpwllgwyngyllgogerychwyrndrobwllllantysiliogogogochensis]
MLGQGCGKRVLARGPCAEVTRCTCGHIHLALGPVTIRVEEEVLRAIGLTMAEALQNLDEPEQGHAEESDSESMPSLLGGWKQ